MGAGEDWINEVAAVLRLFGVEMKRNLSMSYVLGMKTPSLPYTHSTAAKAFCIATHTQAHIKHAAHEIDPNEFVCERINLLWSINNIKTNEQENIAHINLILA